MEAEYMAKQSKKKLQRSNSILSLLIGATLVIVIAVLAYSLFTTTKQQNAKTTSQEQEKITLPTSYTVTEGDTLWDIAVVYFNSGYNWVDIAKANTFESPDMLAIGQVLTIPNTQPIRVERGQILDGATTDTRTTKHTEVTVQPGDSLWLISERSYGTGYKWVDIAKANAIITDPDLIYPGTILRLP